MHFFEALPRFCSAPSGANARFAMWPWPWGIVFFNGQGSACIAFFHWSFTSSRLGGHRGPGAALVPVRSASPGESTTRGVALPARACNAGRSRGAERCKPTRHGNMRRIWPRVAGTCGSARAFNGQTARAWHSCRWLLRGWMYFAPALRGTTRPGRARNERRRASARDTAAAAGL